MKDLVKFSISDEYWGWVLLKTKSRSQILNINLGMCFKARASKPWTTYFCLFKAVSTENRPCFLSVSPTGLKLKTKHWKYIKKYLLPIPMLAICFSYFPSLLMRPCCLILTCKILVPNTSCKPRLLYFYPPFGFCCDILRGGNFWQTDYRIRVHLQKSNFNICSRCLKITEKVSFNIVSGASYVYILSGQKLIKNAKNGPFWRVFESLKLAVKQCYQTGKKMPKFQKFKCDILSNFQTIWASYVKRFFLICKNWKSKVLSIFLNLELASNKCRN